MRRFTFAFLFLSLFLLGCGSEKTSTSSTASSATVFEGATLLVGGDVAPIQNSTLIIENDKILSIGKKGEVVIPAGATRVDVTGKTVMPAIVDMHSHLGYTVVRTNETTKETYSRENLIDHLQRYAYYGIAATLSLSLIHI